MKKNVHQNQNRKSAACHVQAFLQIPSQASWLLHPQHLVVFVEVQNVLVGQLDEGDGRIVLVRQPGVRVDVRYVLLVEVLHQLLQAIVDVAKTLAVLAGALQFVEAGHIIAGLEHAAGVQVEHDVHALVLEALDPVVDAGHAARVEAPGVGS